MGSTASSPRSPKSSKDNDNTKTNNPNPKPINIIRSINDTDIHRGLINDHTNSCFLNATIQGIIIITIIIIVIIIN